MTSKHIVTLLTCWVALHCLTVSSAFSATKLIYPPDKVSVYEETILVVGKAEKTDELPVGLKIINTNQERRIDVNTEGMLYWAEVSLDAGDTTIEAVNGAGAALASLTIKLVSEREEFKPGESLALHPGISLANCRDCHEAFSKENTKKMASKTMSCLTSECHADKNSGKFRHGPVAEKLCFDCHNPHGTVYPAFLRQYRAELCFQCHKEARAMLEESVSSHFPVQKGDCIACHDPHSSNLEYHLKRNTIAELCASCHMNRISSYKYMHDPVESGDCNACHAPHVSKHKGLLVESATALCLMCHEDRKEEFVARHVHAPVKKDCGLCHDPHGSSLPNHLRVRQDEEGNYITFEKPYQETCLLCHEELNPEIAKAIRSAKVTHKPVVEDKCTVCHTPHSTDYPKQLRVSLHETCYSCHPEIKKLITESKFHHGPVRTDDCAQCHLVHGSEYRALLRGNFTNKYYDKFDLKNFELCFNCHNPKAYTEAVSKETGFRNGEKNLHFVHVNDPKKGRTCISCHDIHASNQEKHIRSTIPYKRRFTITLEFTKSLTGGGCVVGCHKPRQYDRDNPVGN